MRVDGAPLPVSPAMGALHATRPGVPAGPGAAPGAQTGEGPSPFAKLLRGLGAEMERGESLARAAVGDVRRSVELGSAELLALQAGIYRYSEAIDLAARLIDRSTSAVKTVLQGQ